MAVKAKDNITVYHVIDIDSTTWYYNLQPSTATPPAKPTTDPPASPWVTTEPTYTEGSTNSLYVVEKTKYSDGSFEYTDVSLSSSYEAAKIAYNKAVQAANTAISYIVDVSNGVFVHADGTPDDPTNANAKGVLIQDDVRIIIGGTAVAKYGSSIEIGTNANTKITIDSTNGLKIGNKITLDTSGNASFTGKITSTSGNIGGWDISNWQIVYKTQITVDSTVYDSQVYMRAKSGSDGSAATATTHAFGVQHKLPSETNWTNDFVVRHDGYMYARNANISGQITATSGTIGGWTISDHSISSVNGTKGTGLQIPSSGTWAIAVGYDTTTPALGWSTAAFRVNHSGQMWATDAHITGTITGSAGEFTQSFKVFFPVTKSGSSITTAHVIDVNSNGGFGLARLRGTNLGTASEQQDPSKSAMMFFTNSSGTGSKISLQAEEIELTCFDKCYIQGNTLINGGLYFGTSLSTTIELYSLSGTLVSLSTFRTMSALGTGGKTAWNDTNKGCWLTSSGNIHLMDSATSGGAIGFHYNFSASATTILHEATAGVLTNTGRLETKDWTGTRRTPVSSIAGDGLRVGYMKGTSATNLVVCAQWGTAGGTFSEKNVTVSSSDIRLKKNVEDCEVDSAMDVINRIKMHSFDWLYTDKHQRIGFIADELEEIDPKLSIGGGTDIDGMVNYKSVDTFYLLGYLVKAMQELSTELTKLKGEVA